MKFNLSTLLLFTAVIALVVLVFVQRNTHHEKLAKLTKDFEAKLTQLNDIADMESKARFAINVNRWSRANDSAYELAVENEMVILIVELFLAADTVNQSKISLEKYGDSPAEVIAGGLLNELDCDSVDFFTRYADDRKLVLRKDDFKKFVESASSHSSIWKNR